MLSVLTQVFAIVSIVAMLWVFYGYSLAFTNGGGLNDYVGGFSKAFLKGVDANAVAATFSNGVVIPEYVYMAFQMTFACITPALIVGAFAERIKFSALIVFIVLWVTFIYFPIAHMVWYWGGPDAIGDAAKAVGGRGDRRRRQGGGRRPSSTRSRRTPASLFKMGRAGLRRRHRRAHQRRHRRPRRRADASASASATARS